MASILKDADVERGMKKTKKITEGQMETREREREREKDEANTDPPYNLTSMDSFSPSILSRSTPPRICEGS